MGQVPATSPFNSNQFEFVGRVAGTKMWFLRLEFLTKMGRSHEGTWTPGLVPSCVPTFSGLSGQAQAENVCCRNYDPNLLAHKIAERKC